MDCCGPAAGRGSIHLTLPPTSAGAQLRPAAFVDTTIVYDALLKTGTKLGKSAQAALALYRDSEIPEYAIKELKAGPLQYLVYLHNVLAIEQKLSRALARIKANIQFQPRRAATTLEALSHEQALLSNRASPNFAASIGVKFDLDTWQATEIRTALRTRIVKAWKRRNSLAKRISFKLSCYSDSKPAVDKTGQLFIPNRDCSVTDCAMRQEMQKNSAALKLLIDASNGQQTNEGKRRAAVLQKLYNACPSLSPKECRNLGDAVFAFYAPQAAEILTTNVTDHRVLAGALHKTVVSPNDLGV